MKTQEKEKMDLVKQVERYKQDEENRAREEVERQKAKKEETMQKVSDALELLSQKHELSERYRDDSPVSSGKRYRSKRRRN